MTTDVVYAAVGVVLFTGMVVWDWFRKDLGPYPVFFRNVYLVLLAGTVVAVASYFVHKNYFMFWLGVGLVVLMATDVAVTNHRLDKQTDKPRDGVNW